MSIWQHPKHFFVARVLVTAVLVGAPVACGVPGQTKTSDVLERLEERRARVRTLYHKTKTTLTDKGNRDTRSLILETWESNDKDARRFHTTSTTSEAGGEKAKQVVTHTVCDGETTWREVVQGGAVMVIKSEDDASSSGLRELLKTGRSKITGREKIEGETCTVVEITTSHRGADLTHTYWISEAHGLILKSRTTLRDGSVSQMTTVSLKVNEPLSGVIFNYTPPEGATVIDTGAFERRSD